jgi:hypothetical protein
VPGQQRKERAGGVQIHLLMGRSGAEDSELQIFLLGAACRSADILKPGPSGPGFVVAFAFPEWVFASIVVVANLHTGGLWMMHQWSQRSAATRVRINMRKDTSS